MTGFSCECAYSEVRRYRQSNGVEIFVRQCLNCGRNLGAVAKAKLAPAEDTVREWFDTVLRDRWERLQQEHFRKRREAHELERAAKTNEWWQRYKKYLLSEDWHKKREAVFERDKNYCQARMKGCQSRAIKVHHLCYDFVENEPLFHLIAVCANCHDQLHPAEG